MNKSDKITVYRYTSASPLARPEYAKDYHVLMEILQDDIRLDRPMVTDQFVIDIIEMTKEEYDEVS